LHLAPGRPHVTAAFHAFARGPARAASAVYVMGDIFDAWLGDDQRSREPFARDVLASMRALSDAGTALYLARGNRDFLLGEAFARDAGATLLGEQTIVEIAGTRTLLTHGDEFCTDDVAYQRFRAWSRNPRHQAQLLALPYVVRSWIGGGLRRKSRSDTARKPESILDVNLRTVEQAFRANGMTRIVHGHTHRPARHPSVVDGRACERIVLADWDDRGHYVAIDRDGIREYEIAA
jgi:UDP-2,3-diacylglucosamine hydrolase